MSRALSVQMTIREAKIAVRRFKSQLLSDEEKAALNRLRMRMEDAIAGSEEQAPTA